MVECDPARKAAGFHSKDQKNAKMACPRNGAHVPILFRSKTGANAGRLWWKCLDCLDRNDKPGQLIGLDAELEPSGVRLVDEMEAQASKKRVAEIEAVAAKRRKPEQELAERAAPAIVASGRGLDWVALHDRVNEVQRLQVTNDERLKRIEDRLERLNADFCERFGSLVDTLAQLTVAASAALDARAKPVEAVGAGAVQRDAQ
jgi:hypothetical protein